MLLRILMWFVGWRMRRLSTRDPAFIEMIAERQGTLQVTTGDGKAARYYHFDNGAFSTAGGITAEPHVTMNFESAGFGFSLFLQIRKNQMAVMEAMQQGKVTIDGDLQFALWFTGLVIAVFKREKNQ